MVKLNEGQIFYCPDFSKKHLYLIIFALCSLFRRIFPFIIESSGLGEKVVENFNKNCLFDMLSNFLADFLTGTYKIYLFIKDKNKIKKKETLIKKSIEANTLNDKIIPEMKQKFVKIMLIISIVDIVAQLCLLLFSYYDTDGCSLSFSKNCGNKPKINEDDLVFTVAINIVFRYIFSRFLLILYIYFHHKVSLIIMTLSFIPLIIFNIITLSKRDKASEMIVYIILNIFMTILYAFEDVMNKVALNNLVIRPYELMLYKSLFQLPLFIFIIFMVCLFDKINPTKHSISLWNYIIGNKKKWAGLSIYRLSFIISNIFRTLSLIKVIEILTPNDLSILKSLEFVILSTFSLSKGLIYIRKNGEQEGSDIKFYILELICCFFLLLASCIANEIFIINRFDLAKRTNYFKGYKTNQEFEDEISSIQKLKNQSEQERENSLFNSSTFLEFSDMQ